MDLNNDGKCRDAFYRRTKVSSANGGATGLNGLFDSIDPPSAPNNNFGYNGHLMVWSAGPDGMIDPKVAANLGANKDNVLSWK